MKSLVHMFSQPETIKPPPRGQHSQGVGGSEGPSGLVSLWGNVRWKCPATCGCGYVNFL